MPRLKTNTNNSTHKQLEVLFRIMNTYSFFLFLCQSIGFSKSNYVKPDIIPAVLDELKINQPIIQNELIDAKDLTKIVKHLSYNGYKVSFFQDRTFHMFQKQFSLIMH